MKVLSDIDTDGYAKAVRINDWGYLGYFVKAKASDFGTIGINEQDPRDQLKPGMKVHVKWPNGVITLETLVGHPHSEQIQDQGHLPQNVESQTVYVQTMSNGLAFDIPVEQLRVKIAR